MGGIEHDERLLTEKEVSKLLNISVDTLRAWRRRKNKEKTVPYIKVGTKLVRYRPSDIDEFLNKNREKRGY